MENRTEKRPQEERAPASRAEKGLSRVRLVIEVGLEDTVLVLHPIADLIGWTTRRRPE